MSEYILEMRNITKAFPGVKALDNVNLKVREGEIHSLCGENGAGKSTLMKVLSGCIHTARMREIFCSKAPSANSKILSKVKTWASSSSIRSLR